LPSWVDEGRASPALRAAWSRYVAEVRRHEEHHKDIAVAAAREMDRAIRTAPAQRSCADVRRYIAAQINQIRQKERRQQHQFDRTSARIVLAGVR
jgi:predicted secreted Zn-dependent protease